MERSRLTHNIQHKANKPMMRRKRQQNPINKHNMLKVIDDALSVEEIHRRSQKIPIQGFGETEAFPARRHVGDSDDFFEAHNLNDGDDDQDVDVSGEEGEEESRHHY